MCEGKALGKDSLDDGDYKWAAVQAYYSMFYAGKALVLAEEYREKSHYCLMIALQELYVKRGRMDQEMVNNLELCLHLRHDADYGSIYDKESAWTAIGYAKTFLTTVKKLISSV